jgi:hypothetical protein
MMTEIKIFLLLPTFANESIALNKHTHHEYNINKNGMGQQKEEKN